MSSSTLPAESFSTPSRILSKKNLLEAWALSRDCSANPGGRGIDRVKAISFTAKLDERCDQIVREVKRGGVRFSKLRPRPIPKPDTDKERLICIPTVRDRLIQRAMLAHIEKKVTVFEVSKFAMKNNGGTQQAISKCKELRERHPYVVKTDIIQFFDNISRDKLKVMCRRLLGRSNLIPLLDQVIDTEISGHNNKFTQKYGVSKGKGIRQGMPLSPMLANIALYELDKFISRNKIPALRYVDDIVIFASSKEQANRYLTDITKELSQLDLGLPPVTENSKTEFIGPNGSFIFLGVEIYFSEKSDRWEHRVPVKQIEKILNTLFDLGKLDYLLSNNLTLHDFSVKIAGKRRAYKNAYKGAKNIDYLIQKIDQARNTSTLSIFSELFGPDAIGKLDAKGKQFLNLSFENVDPEF